MNWLFGILDFCLKAFFQISKNSILTMREQLGTTYIKLNSLNIFFFLRKKLVKIIEIMNLIELWIINYSNDFVILSMWTFHSGTNWPLFLFPPKKKPLSETKLVCDKHCWFNNFFTTLQELLFFLHTYIIFNINIDLIFKFYLEHIK